jgi:hypothetical protein
VLLKGKTKKEIRGELVKRNFLLHRFLVLDTGYSAVIASLFYFCAVVITELEFLCTSSLSGVKVKITLSPCTL